MQQQQEQFQQWQQQLRQQQQQQFLTWLQRQQQEQQQHNRQVNQRIEKRCSFEMNPLKVLIWNANGISSKAKEIELFAHNNSVDILLLTEIRMKRGDTIKIYGCACYPAFRPSRNNNSVGGVAVLVRTTLRHFPQRVNETRNIQMSSVNVATALGDVEFSAIYSPPRVRIDEMHFINTLRACGQNTRHWLWGDTYNSPRGRELAEAISVTGSRIFATGSPTRYPYVLHHTPSCTDFALYHEIPDFRVGITQSWDLDSDHLALVINIKTEGINVKANCPLITRHTDLLVFRQHLGSSIQLNTTLNSGEDIEMAVNSFTESIYTAAAASTPSQSQIGSSYGIRLTRETRDLLSQKRRLRRRAIRTQDPWDRILWNRAARQLF